MRFPIRVSVLSPLRISRFKLDTKKAEEFNSGKFARTDYKYLYRMVIDKSDEWWTNGENRYYAEIATPSFAQVLYSIRVLWGAHDGDPYERHDHPVVMQAFDLLPIPMESQDKEADKRFQKSYSKNKQKQKAKK